MTPEWPESLPPRPRVEGYRETFADTLVRTKMDQGPDKLRARTTAGVVMTEGYWLLTAAQLLALESFYKDDLGGGAKAFTKPHPRTGDDVLCRFCKPPEFSSQNGTYYRVHFEMEILPTGVV